jgi:hypothetical protein
MIMLYHLGGAIVRVMRPLVLVSLGLVGCGRPVTERSSPMPTIAGRWEAAGGGGALELTLSVRGTLASGVGRLTDAGGRVTQVTVRGQCTHPTFALDLLAHDRILGRYVGRLDAGGALRGVLSDSDLPTDSLILVRPTDREPPRVTVPHKQ